MTGNMSGTLQNVDSSPSSRTYEIRGSGEDTFYVFHKIYLNDVMVFITGI